MALFNRGNKNTNSETIGEWMRRELSNQMTDEVGERMRGGTLHGLHRGQTIGEGMREENAQADRDARRRNR